MVAFAANSVLGRLALVEQEAGAGGFALIRLVSGAVALGLILLVMRKPPSGDWRSGAALLGYAAFFSYAYIALPAGTGALILFAFVQITMVGAGLLSGERLTPMQWLGLSVAIAALAWLLSPGLEAPSPVAALSMAMAGVSWGFYSLYGRRKGDPTAATAGNFIRASILAAGLAIPAFIIAPEPMPTSTGVALAILSGAGTSGLGYIIWYTALKGLSSTKAGIAQLTVPALAAAGGVLLLSEPLTTRFILASLLILGGVGLATLTPGRSAR
ncbi:MAG: DMT family transporter [Pseudomonadota bacterium]